MRYVNEKKEEDKLDKSDLIKLINRKLKRMSVGELENYYRQLTGGTTTETLNAPRRIIGGAIWNGYDMLDHDGTDNAFDGDFGGGDGE